MVKKIFVPIFLIALIVSGCGNTKDKIQGNWEDEADKGYQLEVKDNVFEITQSGLTLKGKIEEEDDGSLKADINGEKADVKYEDDKLIIDDMKFKKID
ncbi:putative lipoprotein NlpE involved in copper resistance [Mammaliicoccus lentus]